MFICDVPYSHPIIMLTYYAAQLGIALSVVDSYDNHEVNREVIQHQDVMKGIKIVFHHMTSSISSANDSQIISKKNPIEKIDKKSI